MKKVRKQTVFVSKSDFLFSFEYLFLINIPFLFHLGVKVHFKYSG